jgi:hypothetical protein
MRPAITPEAVESRLIFTEGNGSDRISTDLGEVHGERKKTVSRSFLKETPPSLRRLSSSRT